MPVHVKVEAGVARVTMDRQEALNALNAEMLDGLEAAFTSLAEDASLRVVILTGAGKAFAAGGDIKVMAELDPNLAQVFATRGQNVFDRIADFPHPVIGAINGFALGGGCELALACDFRIASETAKVGQPEVGLGLIPGYGGTQRLARLVGPSTAKYLIFTGELISATKAMGIGLIDEVVPAEHLMARCEEIAGVIAAKAPVAVTLSKQAVDLGLETTLIHGLNLEAELFAKSFRTADRKAGLTAFIQKRTAQFNGM
jgi:enoyl-CoA hydratase